MSWADPILEYGGFLLAGTSAFLVLGLLINLMQRAPIQRLRIAELAVGCALAFTILTFAPMPRAFVSEVAPAETTPLAPLPAETDAGFQLPFPIDQGLFVLWLGGTALSAPRRCSVHALTSTTACKCF